MIHVPLAIPETMPPEPIVAIDVLALIQLPPLIASLSVVVELSQTIVAPVMDPAVGKALTVTIICDTALPQSLVTV